MKSIKQMERDKELIYDRYVSELTKLYSEELLEVKRWFGDKFPKRSLDFINAMGTCFWVIDGEIWNCEVYGYRHDSNWDLRYTARPWTRKEKLLAPLVNFYLSITDHTWLPECGIDV